MSEIGPYLTTYTAYVEFEFPDDPAHWNIEEQEKKFDDAWANRRYT